MRVGIVHERLAQDARPDETDSEAQATLVAAALDELGYRHRRIGVDGDLSAACGALTAMRPDVVFNLMEGLAGVGSRASIFPRLFERLGLAYTGSDPETIDLTTDKPRCKQVLVDAGIPTPAWAAWRDGPGLTALADVEVILKPTHEDASLGITDASVVREPDADALLRAMAGAAARVRRPVFAEAYVAGRELNVSLLARNDGADPDVLPPTEIIFEAFPDDKPRIVGYDAKWTTDSFAYRHTPRRFPGAHDRDLMRDLSALAVQCWRVCGLRGYGRVDFRVDHAGRPWVIEVNANPCLSDDAGFMAAGSHAGLSPAEVIDRVLRAARASFASAV